MRPSLTIARISGSIVADLCFRIDHRDHHRPVVGNAEQPFAVHLAVASEAHHSHGAR